MKKSKPQTPTRFPVTSVRLDPKLVDRAVTLARENKRAGVQEDALYKIMGRALSDYLDKKDA